MLKEFHLSSKDLEKLLNPDERVLKGIRRSLGSERPVKVEFVKLEFCAFTDSSYEDEILYGGSVSAIYEVTYADGSVCEYEHVIWEECD